MWERHFQRQDNSRRKKVYQRKFPNCLVFPEINQDKRMHALKREREALAAVEMEAGHGSRVSVSTGY